LLKRTKTIQQDARQGGARGECSRARTARAIAERSFVQGAITGVPGKVLLDGDVAHLMVPAPVGHHLRDRIVEVCDDLGPAIGSPRPFVRSAGGSGRC